MKLAEKRGIRLEVGGEGKFPVRLGEEMLRGVVQLWRSLC